MSTKYREVLYANYHTNQSGRASLTDAKSLFERERKQFEREILPKLSDVKNEARIFDLGCGSGSLLMALKKEFLLGIYISVYFLIRRRKSFLRKLSKIS